MNPILVRVSIFDESLVLNQEWTSAHELGAPSDWYKLPAPYLCSIPQTLSGPFGLPPLGLIKVSLVQAITPVNVAEFRYGGL